MFKSCRTCNMFNNTHILSSEHRIAIVTMCFSWDLFLLNNLWKGKLWSSSKDPVTPNGDATAFVCRVWQTCQRAVGTPRNTCKISNSPFLACTQRPHSVPTASTRRSHSVFIASMTLLRRASICCSVFTAGSRGAHNVITVRTRRAHDYHRV